MAATSGGDDMVAHWLGQAGRIPVLTPAEVLHLGGLVRRWQDHPKGLVEDPDDKDLDPEHRAVIRRGLRARDRMVSGNLRLVASVAARFRNYEAPLIDRLQNGALGLARAVEKFDPARGYTFSTYAYWWIRQAIDHGELAESAIYLPAPAHAAVHGRRNGSCAPPNLEAALAASSVRSLDAPLPGDHDGNPSTLGDSLAGAGLTDPLQNELIEFFRFLDEREQRLLRGRYGIGGPVVSTAELAAREGLNPHRTGRLIRDAVGTLRQLSGVDPAPVVASPPQGPPPPPALRRPERCCQLSLEFSTLNP